MRIRVHQETRFRFEQPVKFVIQTLRLTPRNHDGQHVADWRIDLDADCRLIGTEDAHGNIVHSFSCQGPIDALTIEVSGEVDTIDSAGVMRGAVERLPHECYQRDTPLTLPDAALRAFAEDATKGKDDTLGRLHALLDATADAFKLAEGPDDAGSVAATIARKAGTAVDLAHVLIAAARHLAIPARFVSGYVATDGDAVRIGIADGPEGQARAVHAWMEGFVPTIGWIGFDPSLGFCPKGNHVRVAAGLDHLEAMPIRAARHGFARASVTSDIHVVSTDQ